MKNMLTKFLKRVVSAYQYLVVSATKRMPLTDDEIFNYRVNLAEGKFNYLKPGLSEANKIIKVLGLSVGFDKSGMFWWAEDANGEYVRGKTQEEVVLLIAVVYNSDIISNFKPEYEIDATKLDPQT